MQIAKINLSEKFRQIDTYWDPHIAAALNGQHVRLAKVLGEFVWHHHPEADELFLVVSGTLRIRLRDGEIALGPGELCIIPRGVEHLPVAEEEVHLLLFEPAGTVNTGNVTHAKTRTDLKWI